MIVDKRISLSVNRRVVKAAMQARLASKQLDFGEVFLAKTKRILFVVVFIDIRLVAGSVRERTLAA